MDISGIKAIVDSANSIITWSLSLLGGSLLAVLSTSYIRPVKGRAKFFYLLLVPGWVLIMLSVKNGNDTIQSGIMGALNPNLFMQVVQAMNQTYSDQLKYFYWALLFFGAWLLCYLIWWLFQDSTN